MKVLITGSNGLLGQKIVKRCLKHNIPFLATSQGENRNPDCPSTHYRSLDLRDFDEVRSLLNEEQPSAIIHTAAITNVDACELDPELCQLVNVDASLCLSNWCEENNVHFQLLSTDFVFDGTAGPYVETDTVHPLSVYAQSKVAAEDQLVNNAWTNWSIIRTIIVFGTAHGLSRSNMVLWALDALPKNQTMKLVNDQFRAPTWADDLAYACVEVILRNETGIFHISGEETKSVADLVLDIADVLNIASPAIELISSDTLNQPAKRPPRTGFVLEKAKSRLDFRPTPFKLAVKALSEEI